MRDLEDFETNDVGLYTGCWVTGTKAVQYFGPIKCERFLADAEVGDRAHAWYIAEVELLESLRFQARELGANAVVGLEVTTDPFATLDDVVGLHLHAVGTAALLVSAHLVCPTEAQA